MYPVMKWALVPLLLLLCLITRSLLALLFQVTPALLTKLITDPEFHFAVLMSLATSLTSLVLAFLIAVPAAWVMVRGISASGWRMRCLISRWSRRRW